MDDAKPSGRCPKCGRERLLPALRENSAPAQLSGLPQLLAITDICPVCKTQPEALLLSPTAVLPGSERLWRFTYSGIL